MSIAKSAAGLVAPKLDTVRVGFIGVGARGGGHVGTMLNLDGVEINAICDPHKPSLDGAIKRCVDKSRKAPEGYDDYRRLLDRNDIDAVVISTPWEDHVPMAVAAMKAGKHAFIEVPAATTVEGCWELVETAEQTQLHCMMMENCNYGREELMVLNMCRLGVFGELLHGEAAYIHDLRGQMHEIDHGTGSWRTYEYTKHNGNLYPTHGLGPVAQYMNVNRGDRLDFLCSVSSPSRMRSLYAREAFPEGHERRTLEFVCGDLSTSILKTVLGKTILVQWDEQLPRPYSRLNLIQGTRGIWAGFPNRCALERQERGGAEHWLSEEELQEVYEKYDHPLWKRLSREAEQHGGHGGMDFVMLWRIVYCLRNGEPMDQDVYDAASWSVVGPLSEESAANRGKSMDIPDFTRGQWTTMPPLGIVD
ncbi:MAG TPA: Gfo/Idh/MocA family oxidoreductase [Fimbriimonadaceae bacterium]|nr:Gfo/Idh/MocA family oxidoreductase [Fimbriimonadaceae bacterium]